MNKALHVKLAGVMQKTKMAHEICTATLLEQNVLNVSLISYTNKADRLNR